MNFELGSILASAEPLVNGLIVVIGVAFGFIMAKGLIMRILAHFWGMLGGRD